MFSKNGGIFQYCQNFSFSHDCLIFQNCKFVNFSTIDTNLKFSEIGRNFHLSKIFKTVNSFIGKNFKFLQILKLVKFFYNLSFFCFVFFYFSKISKICIFQCRRKWSKIVNFSKLPNFKIFSHLTKIWRLLKCLNFSFLHNLKVYT